MDTRQENLLKNLAVWLRVDSDTLSKYVDGNTLSRLEGILDRKTISFREILMRKMGYRLLSRIPEKLKYFITDWVKILLNVRRLPVEEISDCIFIKTYLDLKKKINPPNSLFDGRRGAVCISHDVDSIECYNFVEEVVRLNNQHKIKSTFNFLTHWGYKVDRSLLRNMEKDGFEVGLHGYTHDIALGYRGKRKIRKHIKKAMDELGLPVKGFRAPAFAVSRDLLEVLQELGFKYDGSLKVRAIYGGVETCYPYKYPGIDIWEVPLTTQDDRLFRDQYLTCEEGLGIAKELTERIIGVNGAMVINTHPRLLKMRLRFYTEFLSWLSKKEGIWICTMGELVEHMEKNQNAR